MISFPRRRHSENQIDKKAEELSVLLAKLDLGEYSALHWVSANIGRCVLRCINTALEYGGYFELAKLGVWDPEIDAYPRKSYFIVGIGQVIGVLGAEIRPGDDINKVMSGSAEFELAAGLWQPVPSDTDEVIEVLRAGYMDTVKPTDTGYGQRE